MRAFLNYASEDREHALWLHDRLIEAGLQEVWLDRSDIKGGDHAEQGRVLSAYGELQRVRSRHDHAVELLGRALDIHQDLDDLCMQAATLKSLRET